MNVFCIIPGTQNTRGCLDLVHIHQTHILVFTYGIDLALIIVSKIL